MLFRSPEYEFEFEETSNPGVTFTHVSSSRWCNLANVTPAIQANKFYNVRVRPVIDGTPYCYGNYCQIGVVNTPSNDNAGVATRTAGSLVSSVFPNPSASSFRMVLQGFNSDQNVDVRITDMAGRTIENMIYDTQAGSMEFGENLTDGIYLVSAQQGDHTTVTRIVKTH